MVKSANPKVRFPFMQCASMAKMGYLSKISEFTKTAITMSKRCIHPIISIQLKAV